MATNEYRGIMYNPPVTAAPCHPPLHKGGFEAPLGQQGEPLAANGRPYLLFRRFSENCMRPHPALRATCTLRYDCHRQSFIFQIRCAEHHLSGEGFWGYGLPHQCEHWFAMTTSILAHFSNVTGRENPALLFCFSTTGGRSGDRWSPHPDSRCPGATGQYWRCPGKR